MITRSKYIIENRVNWTYWAFWYIELQAIFKQCILQTVLNKYFFVYICVTKNLLFQKLSCILHCFDLVFGVTVLKVLCLWCFLYVTGNSGFISYSRYNLLQIVIKIIHMWRRCGAPQNFCLAFIDELEKQLFIKKTVKWAHKNVENVIFTMLYFS